MIKTSRRHSPGRDRVVLLTGAGKGLGRATADALAKAGANLVLVSRSRKDLIRLRRDHPTARIVLVTGDVARETTARRAVAAALHEFRRLDVLINNAGVLTPRSPLARVRVSDWDRSLAVNLRGPFLFMKHALAILVRRRSGLVINVSSGAGRRPAPMWGPYAVSKAGLESLTRLTDAETRERGVRAVTVNPGGVRTRMRAKAYPNEDPATLPAPEAVAAMIASVALGSTPIPANGDVDFQTWRSRGKR